jgi:hypothetical protein
MKAIMLKISASYIKNGNIQTFWRKGMTAQTERLAGFDYVDKDTLFLNIRLDARGYSNN